MKDWVLRRYIVMKLYYAPGACSLSPHIALREAGLPFDLIKVDLRGKKTEAGDDFSALNPKGYVPVLELDGGERLTEGPAIVQYIADQAPQSKLAPPNGTLARYRLQEWLNFITAELHKQFSPLFNAAVPEEFKAMQRKKLRDRLAWVDGQLEGKSYLMGEDFSVADAYLYTVTNWAQPMNIDLAGLDRLAAYRERVAARPAVQQARRTEGTLK
jgi:glutathione S-transferase